MLKGDDTLKIYNNRYIYKFSKRLFDLVVSFSVVIIFSFLFIKNSNFYN